MCPLSITMDGQLPACSPDEMALRDHYRYPGQLEVDPEGGVTGAVENLRRERYPEAVSAGSTKLLQQPLVRKAYYRCRPFLPLPVRRHLQRAYLSDWRTRAFPKWPVDCSVEDALEGALRSVLQHNRQCEVPFIWFWPNGHSSCLIMTHDVEQPAGLRFSSGLMDLNESVGLRASFQISPEERYDIPECFIKEVLSRGCELNIHDLNHDGKLFQEREEFLRRAERIRMHGRKFGARGFRSGALYRNSDWLDDLGFDYDMSVPNVAHLDPQRGGCCTVTPYFIGNTLELPLTTTQDYALFHFLGEYSLRLWEQQIDLILARHGMVSFDIHPDYVSKGRELSVYRSLLGRLAELIAERNVWAALPGEVDRWWRQRAKMELAGEAGAWRIEGEGSQRARIAYATLDGDRVVYTIDRPGSV